MVNNQLNVVFHSLSDPTRRDIVRRVSDRQMSVGELVTAYDMSFPAISKHLKVLEQAQLIAKHKDGRVVYISLNLDTLQQVDVYMDRYRRIWEERFNKLDELIRKET
jgi:DNA-binding transcriptional ArsR family regulator